MVIKHQPANRQLSGSDPIGDYGFRALSPQDAARLLGRPAKEVLDLIDRGLLKTTGKFKRLVALADIELMLGHRCTVFEYFRILVQRNMTRASFINPSAQVLPDTPPKSGEHHGHGHQQ